MNSGEMKFKVENLINNIVEKKLGIKNSSYLKPFASRNGDIHKNDIAVVGKHTTYNVVGERNFKHYLKDDKIMFLFGEN
ncbi:ac55 [Malacosoma neustria nucleopolyhedrovirus]|uniref:ac55 n=1 Tax=Malacosoma neustria nuclear polyhedrosis virus TaxID=38012 RepID=UPI000E35F217|nr:ac55 [Malacosoma neustria nucleopolyhedrovirus]AUF81571.1 ac55 [Malacosoma neustria nucleopolyhedrovirus]